MQWRQLSPQALHWVLFDVGSAKKPSLQARQIVALQFKQLRGHGAQWLVALRRNPGWHAWQASGVHRTHNASLTVQFVQTVSATAPQGVAIKVPLGHVVQGLQMLFAVLLQSADLHWRGGHSTVQGVQVPLTLMKKEASQSIQVVLSQALQLRGHGSQMVLGGKSCVKPGGHSQVNALKPSRQMAVARPHTTAGPGAH